ncbi:hypothetical protein [Macrococcus animalis]
MLLGAIKIIIPNMLKNPVILLPIVISAGFVL